MELNQKIFKRLHDYYKRVTAKNIHLENTHSISLEPLKSKLTLIARAISAKPIQISTSEREGGWKDYTFYLPEKFSFTNSSELNTGYYLFRIVYLNTQMKLGFNLSEHDTTIEIAQKNSGEKANHILKAVFKEYPNMETFYTNLTNGIQQYFSGLEEEFDPTWLHGRFMCNTEAYMNIVDLEQQQNNPTENKITTELEANPSDDVKCIKVDTKQQEDYVFTHNFEKVDTIEEFNGNWRDFDGDDTLSDEEDALRNLELKHTVRVDDAVHSVYKSEFSNSIVDVLAQDSNVTGSFIYYDEWNHKKRHYLKNHCKLFHKHNHSYANDYYQNAIKNNQKSLTDLRKMFAQIANDLEKVSRLTAGDNIDFDAFVNAFVDIKLKKPVDERLFTSRLKRKKEISILILLDTSLSTDGYSAGNRILDVEKEAVILFGEVLFEYDIDFQIDTFSSRTRNQAVYTTIKSFSDNWLKARNRIGAIQPENYTRMGTALRHAGQLLKQESNPKKWILLFSDGKPNDFDKYEGKHGIEDVKQALKELRKNHIQTFSFAIESSAKYYLPMMFGQTNYNILSQPNEIPRAFAKFYKQASK